MLFVMVCAMMALGCQASLLPTCPDVTPSNDHDLQELSGLWYIVETTSMSSSFLVDCTVAEISLQTSTQASLRICGRDHSGHYRISSGTCTYVSTGIVQFNLPLLPDLNYVILGTDHTNFLCLYHCSIVHGRVHIYAWIFSRDVSLSSENQAAAYAVFEKNGVPRTLFRPITQDDTCQYFPPGATTISMATLFRKLLGLN